MQLMSLDTKLYGAAPTHQSVRHLYWEFRY
jgi:hypothetical protein